MNKLLDRFTFEREAKWLVVLYVVLPLLALLAAVVIPGLVRRLGS